jgi:hypothetical protein
MPSRRQTWPSCEISSALNSETEGVPKTLCTAEHGARTLKTVTPILMDMTLIHVELVAPGMVCVDLSGLSLPRKGQRTHF